MFLLEWPRLHFHRPTFCVCATQDSIYEFMHRVWGSSEEGESSVCTLVCLGASIAVYSKGEAEQSQENM